MYVPASAHSSVEPFSFPQCRFFASECGLETYKRLPNPVDPPTFYTNFDYFNAVDPAQGSAVYDNPIDAHNRNLTFTSPTSAVLRVDDKDSGPYGRHSARVSSKQTYNDGLFLFDVRHAPYGCGTWPAIWLSDAANWPANGEIDVVESVNQAASGVQTTLHTTKGCEMKGVKRVMAGKPAGADCYNGTDQNAGCGVAGAPSTFGPAFNAGGGGVYAAEVRRDGIRAWFFSRAHVPSDVSGALAPPGGDAHPDPSGWGEALADFPSTHCDVGSHFRNMSVIVDIDLCGQWAGKVYAQDGCPGDCHNYVAFTPGAFADAYWEFGGFRVFQDPAENAGAGRRGAWSWM